MGKKMNYAIQGTIKNVCFFKISIYKFKNQQYK